ncbi:FMN-binding negative transcriptional regulator [Sphingomonas sp.]|jgi:transcriptional regulator|uniref:FMN-binding negative transcriptional regulator n=1 Tax=Sphingomonas sp. TaxID=28214 RepID=UPI002D7E633C|nr:FMN-binding negative transcriptional regulator [Sphingomonas sp.]HEU0043791.1 FMN-binding negative transcriptional regulator [Sphingomonas sp.]
MHPNPVFRPDAATVLDRAAAIGFAHVFAATPAGPIVAHAPLTRHDAELRFHLARKNRLHPHLDGATMLASIAAPDGYVTPNWYELPGNQVPTWNYIAIEIEGVARALPDAALLEHLDRLADLHEPRPGRWTRAKADPAAIATMLRAIGGFAIDVSAMRGTEKLAQHKAADDRTGMVAGLRALADAMERA